MMDILIEALAAIAGVTAVGLVAVGLAVLVLYVPMRLAGLYG